MLFGTDDRAREKSGAKTSPDKKLDSSDRGFGWSLNDNFSQSN
jgi:hypothetical protein